MPTVLVADDNSNIQKAVVTALRDHGVEVITVGNGEAAVRKLTDSHPDLILADIFMPVRNGYEVCEYVKKDERFAHIPVVLLVGAFDPLDEHEVERVHADGVLKKPFVPPDPLVQLVKSFLEKASAGTAPAAPEDRDLTQDVVPGLAGRSPTGTVQLPGPDKTQPLPPEELPDARPGAENFVLGLAEPKAASPVEKTQQINAQEMSKILQRPSALSAPSPAQEEVEEFGARPAAVEFGGDSPLAFADLLHSPEAVAQEEAEAEEEPGGAPMLGFDAFAAAEEHAGAHEEAPEPAAHEPSVAEVHFGGIREEAKTPDPERPPIPVVFDRSEPEEFITEEHVESSGMEIGPAADLVSSSSGWASSEAHGITHPEAGREPELLPEGPGAEGFMTAPLPGPPPAAHEFAIPPASAVPSPEEFEETAKLNAGILQEEVNRAQEIAARIAAQNRDVLAKQALEAAALEPLSGPGIGRAISAVDEMLARHRGPAPGSEPVPARIGTGTEQIPVAEVQSAAAPAEASAAAAARIGTGTEQIPVAEVSAAAPPAGEAEPPSSRVGTGTEQIPVPEFGGIAGAAVAATALPPPVTPEGRAGTGTVQLPAQEIAAQARAAGATPEMIEAVSERVLAQLDPYLIEKISREIVKPIVEAILKRELEKLQ